MLNEHLKEEKLETLLKDQGFDSFEEFHESPYGTFDIGICMNAGCDYILEGCEADTTDNWCEICEDSSVAAIIFLL